MIHSVRYAAGALLGAVSIAFLSASQSKPAAPVNVTFTKDIVPILQEKCQVCHQPDSIAPMSLKTFTEVRPWVRSIRARVAGSSAS